MEMYVAPEQKPHRAKPMFFIALGVIIGVGFSIVAFSIVRSQTEAPVPSYWQTKVVEGDRSICKDFELVTMEQRVSDPSLYPKVIPNVAPTQKFADDAQKILDTLPGRHTEAVGLALMFDQDVAAYCGG